jgi:hypothetical protein
MGGPVVTRRRRRAGLTSGKGMDDALEALARSLGHGKVASIHAPGCPGNSRTGRCDCIVHLVGPAVRDMWQ